MTGFASLTNRRNQVIYLLLLPSILMIISISSQSLWIDEGITALYASQPRFEDLINELVATHRAESLMPGYVLYMWLWTKLFGFSEYVLRLSNFPFIFLVLFIFAAAPLNVPSNQTFRSTNIIFTCASPFIWYYMNEARSYVALFSFSAMGLAGIIIYFYGTTNWRFIAPYLTAISMILGTFFNVSCVFSVPALIVTAFLINIQIKRTARNIVSDWAKPVLFSIPIFMVLSVYCFWAISQGSGGRLQEQTSAGPNFLHIIFVFYEFLGFGGLGPPRNLLRDASSLGIFAPYVIWIFSFVILLTVGIAFVTSRFREICGRDIKNLILPYLCGFISGFFIFWIFSFITHFTFYGRHLIFMYPYFIFSVSGIICAISRVRGNLKFILAFGIIAILISSDIRLRFNDAYFKDNYRLAVKTALSISGPNDPIYWAANYATGAYYGLFYPNIESSKTDIPTTWKRSRKAFFASNWSIELIDENTSNDLAAILVLSKFELFDTKHGWRLFIEKHAPIETREFGVFRIYRFVFDRKFDRKL